jgi:hypothetical protein
MSSEKEKEYQISAELPWLDEKDKDRFEDASLTSRNRGRRQVSRGSMKWPRERLSRNQNKSLLQTIWSVDPAA